ncbi:MAG: hypothetical protein JXA13_04230 [Anaerolineales bacterium]|nr:hypothetical protein [Anaerolineales bacterium]
MNTQLSSRDLGKLSAYLDGELSQAEITRLERRLETEPELRAVLQELHQTRMVLRRLPSRKAPRNFTLSRRMFGQNAPMPGAYYAVRSTLVTVSLVLVLVFVTNVLTYGPMLAVPGSEPMALVADHDAGAIAEQEVSEPAVEVMQTMEYAAPALAEEAPPMDKSVGEQPSEPPAVGEGRATAVAGNEFASAAAATPTPQAASTPVGMASGMPAQPEQVESDELTPWRSATDLQAQEGITSVSGRVDTTQSFIPGPRLWLILEVGLLVFILLLGLAMFIIRQIVIHKWRTKMK